MGKRNHHRVRHGGIQKPRSDSDSTVIRDVVGEVTSSDDLNTSETIDLSEDAVPTVHCFLITTTEEVERRTRESLAWLSRFSGSFAANLHVHTSERLPDNREGCFKAHQNVMRRFLEISQHDDDLVIVFEDDCVSFDNDTVIDEKVSSALDFMRLRKSAGVPCDLFFLGHMPFGKMYPVGFPQHNIQIFQTTNSTTSHAYIVSVAYARKIAEWEYVGQHYDQMFNRTTTQQFCVSPMPFLQKDMPGTYSRYLDRVLIRVRRLIGVERCFWGTEALMKSWWYPEFLAMKNSTPPFQ